MNQKLYLLYLILVVLFTNNVFSAIIDKDDAASYSKKSKYSTIIDSDANTNNENSIDNNYKILGDVTNKTSNNRQKDNNTTKKPKKGAGYVDDSVETKFSVPKGVKVGNNYSNSWSNYIITFNDTTYNGNDYYDFSSDGIQFDFALYFKDYSRIAVYYSTLLRELNTIVTKFAPGKSPNDQVVAGEIYKHAQYSEPYPYGTLYYDYYLRNVDNKLMVIEVFHEKDTDIALKYLDKFSKKN